MAMHAQIFFLQVPGIFMCLKKKYWHTDRMFPELLNYIKKCINKLVANYNLCKKENLLQLLDTPQKHHLLYDDISYLL